MRPAREALILGLILLLALWLRLDGIAFGLDLGDPRKAVLDRVDERGMVSAVREALLAGDLNPRDFLIRGPGAFVVFLAVDAPVVAWRARSHPRGRAGVLADLKTNPSLLHLLHRGTTALAGVLSVWVLYRVLRREFGATSALAGAALLAVSYQHVQDSHLGGVDVFWALFSLCAVGAMMGVVRVPTLMAYAWAGACVGAAVAMKYFAVLLGPLLLVAHVMARGDARRRGAPAPPHAWVAVAGLAAGLGFLLFFPGIFTSFGDLQRTVTAAAGFSSPYWSVGAVLAKLVQHGGWSLGVGFGESACLFALVGLALAPRRGAAGRFLPLALGLLALGLFLTRNSPPRYALSVLVLFAASAGIGLTAVCARVPRWAAALLVIAAVAPSLVRSVAFDRVVARRDTRLDMLEELARRNVPRTEVLAIGSTFGMPRPVGGGRMPYVSLVKMLYGQPWKKHTARVTREEATARLKRLLADPPRLILWNKSGGQLKGDPREIAELLRTRYRAVFEVDARKRDIPLPDSVTMDMLPYARPWLIERPGPVLVLFERIDPPASGGG